PFYDTPSVFGEPTDRTRLAGRDPAAGAHGLRLAETGHAVLAVPWRFEQVAAADPATAAARGLQERSGPAAERHRRERPTAAPGRSRGDLPLAGTALEDSGLAPGAGWALSAAPWAASSPCTWPPWTPASRRRPRTSPAWASPTPTGRTPGTWTGTSPTAGTRTSCWGWSRHDPSCWPAAGTATACTRWTCSAPRVGAGPRSAVSSCCCTRTGTRFRRTS